MSSRAARVGASVIRLSSRAAISEASVGREGSGSEMSTRFLASLGMTGVLRLSSRAAISEARVGREGSGIDPRVIKKIISFF
ncbi:MAG: hypothetical protein PHV77_02335 [Candidatus Omnitrophica bacterium]|nr:hypothetical protein [Candidatus Omnitrophota bacterium]